MKILFLNLLSVLEDLLARKLLKKEHNICHHPFCCYRFTKREHFFKGYFSKYEITKTTKAAKVVCDKRFMQKCKLYRTELFSFSKAVLGKHLFLLKEKRKYW